MLADLEAYSRLEQNLKSLGFHRGENDGGQPQHYKWRKKIDETLTVEVELLCDAPIDAGGVAKSLPGEKGLSALGIPGAYLVAKNYIDVELTAELLDERGLATETVRVANVASFLALKALAYDDRFEEKDAYDIVYCLTHYTGGPARVASEYQESLNRLPGDHFLTRALDVLRDRFATDGKTQGYRKDGPVSYARFVTNPSQMNENAVNQRNAAAVVELFLRSLPKAP